MNRFSFMCFSLVLWLMVTFFPFHSIQATHFMGGNINYECIGPNTYNVFVSIFRDCNGTDFDLELDVNVTSPTCNINTTYQAQLVTSYPQIVTPICPGEPDVCEGTGGTYGVEFYFYKIAITIPDNCPDVLFNVYECCRNNAITTLTNPDDIFFYTTLDTDEAPCNSSPVFSDDLTPFICLGDSITFNQFAYDPDNDSLVFSLTNCLEDDINDPVSYQDPPFNALNPLNSSTPITIDSTTGVIRFTPSSLDVGVLCILVEEYRNGVKIGETIRDIQFTVINCLANDPPVLSGLNGIADTMTLTGDYQLNVCIGEQLCYDIEAFDLNNENIELDFNTNTTGVNFVANNNNTPNASANICWTPSPDDVGYNYFVITATDDACPIRRSNTFIYIIDVDAESYDEFTFTQDSVNCIGGADGSATVSLTGDLSPNASLTWLTTPEQTGFTATDLSAGQYDILLADDSLGCPAIINVEVEEPLDLFLSMGPGFQSIDCTVGDDGILDVATVGGTPPYAYEWSNGVSSALNPNLPQGTYVVTVSDYYGCTNSETFYLQNPSSLIITALTPTTGGYNISCNGYSDGVINLFAALGVPPYTFEWSNGATTQDLLNVPAGTYSVTVTDSQGCIKTTTRTLTEPNGFNINTEVQHASCSGGGLGSIVVNATDAPTPYSYQWSGNVSTTNEALNLTGGTYTVTLTDANGCTVTVSESISSSSAFTLSLGNMTSDVSCNGANDGSLEVIQSGGTEPIGYQWSNMESGSMIDNLASGSYTITATDNAGCVAIETYTVTEPDAIVVNEVLSNYNGFNISCLGSGDGSITISVVGGQPPYAYAWSNGGNMADLVNITAGDYTLTITDDIGCTTVFSTALIEPSALTSSIAVGGATCSGGGDGTATITPNGGVGPYTFLWSDGQTTSTAVNLSAETYTVTITDNQGCTSSNSINVADPPLLTVNTTGTNISCVGGTDGTVTAIGNGGDGNYSFNWDIPASGATQTGLGVGTYLVTITDGNGCTATSMVTLQENPSLVISDIITNSSCNSSNDGSINITVTGGSGSYIFAWSDGTNGEDCLNVPAGNYSVTVTDSNGCSASMTYTINEPPILSTQLIPISVSCLNGNDGSISTIVNGGTAPYDYNWNNNEMTENISNLSAGPYSLTITDANACTAVSTIIMDEPSTGISVSISPDLSICFDANNGNAVATAIGGTGTHTYDWSNNQAGPGISNLIAGTYTVTATDQNGCTATNVMNVNEYAEINVVLTSTTSSCDGGNDGTATVTNISGGSSSNINDYQVIWNTVPSQAGLSATGLVAGQSYTAMVTGPSGCIGMGSIEIANPLPMQVELLDSTPVSCSGESDGSITVMVQGGAQPYAYNWSNGQVSDTATNLNLGTYNVTVTDVAGCTATAAFDVTNPSMLDVIIESTDATCKTYGNGSAMVMVSGGVPPYSYEWSDGQLTQEAVSLVEGSYNVTVTDANDCMLAASVYIGEPDWLDFDADIVDVTCHDDRDGSIAITPFGGTSPYVYSFDGGQTYDDIDAMYGLPPGDYGLAIMDANHCLTLVDSITIDNPMEIGVIIYPEGDVVTYDLLDSVQLAVSVQNQVGALSYEWSALYGDQHMSCTDCPFPWITGLENNRFEVVVTDSNGCTGSETIEVVVNRNRRVFVPSGFTPNGDNVNDVLMAHGETGTRVESFRVYDRWGELLFMAENYDINSTESTHVWDGNFKGKTMTPGVYVWYLKVRYIDGRKEGFEGSSTLLR